MLLDGVEYHGVRARGAAAWAPRVRGLREFPLGSLFRSLLRRASCAFAIFLVRLLEPYCRINFSLQHKGLCELSRPQCVFPRSPRTTSSLYPRRTATTCDIAKHSTPTHKHENTMLSAAKPNYGKSSLVWSMLKLKRQYRCAFDHVYLVCPPASRKSFEVRRVEFFSSANNSTIRRRSNSTRWMTTHSTFWRLSWRRTMRRAATPTTQSHAADFRRRAGQPARAREAAACFEFVQAPEFELLDSHAPKMAAPKKIRDV